MEITYTITKDDLYDFNLYHYNHCPIHQRNYKILKYTVPLIWIGTVIYDSIDELYPWLYWGIQLIVAAIFTSFWFWLLKYIVIPV